MTGSIAERVLDGAMSPATALAYETGSLVSPEAAVRRLHTELPDLGIDNRFAKVAERLGRVDTMRATAVHLDNEAAFVAGS